MTIYRLNYDYYTFPCIDISPDVYRHEASKCKRPLTPNVAKQSCWTEFKGNYYYNPDNPVKNICPDLSNWLTYIVLSKKAKDQLESVLTKYGELLPIVIADDKRYMFNILNATDAIDRFNSKKNIIEGEEMGVMKLAFVEHEVKELFVFNTSYDNFAYIYCTDEFKELIENSDLTTGWSFHEDLRDTQMFGDDVAEQ